MVSSGFQSERMDEWFSTRGHYIWNCWSSNRTGSDVEMCCDMLETVVLERMARGEVEKLLFEIVCVDDQGRIVGYCVIIIQTHLFI